MAKKPSFSLGSAVCANSVFALKSNSKSGSIRGGGGTVGKQSTKSTICQVQCTTNGVVNFHKNDCDYYSGAERITLPRMLFCLPE